MRFFFPLLLGLALSACGSSGEGGPVEVAIIGDREGLLQPTVRLSEPAGALRAATGEGLVAMDAAGQLVPALAERWIVTDDGLSYIFRIRNSSWPGGKAITSGQIRRMLLDNLRRLDGTSLGLDMAKVSDVREMTGRVVEVNLTGPMPDFLRLLAQPEMGFIRDGAGIGPMQLDTEDPDTAIDLLAIPPEQRGQPAIADWAEKVRGLKVSVISAREAVAAFASGKVDLVLNGHLGDLPLADTGPLARGTVRIDAALGQFGLVVRSEEGMLGDSQVREAMAMAIDRSTLMEVFNIGGWQASAEIVPRSIWGDVEPQAPAWIEASIDQRRAQARARIAAWRAAGNRVRQVTIGMPAGPGSALLFRRIAQDLAHIGISARQVEAGKGADLELHDRVARFASARWFLNQFNCSIRPGPCSPQADALVEQSLGAADPAKKAELLARAALELQNANVFISFGAPIRWSLVRGSVPGFAENQWGVHPLYPLSQAPS